MLQSYTMLQTLSQSLSGTIQDTQCATIVNGGTKKALHCTIQAAKKNDAVYYKAVVYGLVQ